MLDGFSVLSFYSNNDSHVKVYVTMLPAIFNGDIRNFKTQDIFHSPYLEDLRILNITFQETVAGLTHNMWFTAIKKNGRSDTYQLFAEALLDSRGSICMLVPALKTLVLHAIPAKNIGSGATH